MKENRPEKRQARRNKDYTLFFLYLSCGQVPITEPATPTVELATNGSQLVVTGFPGSDDLEWLKQITSVERKG